MGQVGLVGLEISSLWHGLRRRRPCHNGGGVPWNKDSRDLMDSVSIPSTSEWVAEFNGQDYRFSTVEALKVFLDQVETAEAGDLFVFMDNGPLPWWRGWQVLDTVFHLLGRGRRDIIPRFELEWTAGYASLCYLDDSWSEHRARDLTNPVAPSEEIRLRISGGEPTPLPLDECMDVSRAFAAIRQFLDTGAR